MGRLALYFILTLAWSCLWAKPAPNRLQTKSEALLHLRELRSQNVKRLKDIDDSLRNQIENSPVTALELEVTRLKTARKEYALRQEFLDRLIFQIDTKYTEGDLRAFLERSLTDMAKVDATSSTEDTGLWKFMKFAAEAIHRLPEQKENILFFLEGYMNRSIANPIRPEDFLTTRNYSNGATSESGKPMSREQAGDLADSRLKELNSAPENHETSPPTKANPEF